MIMVVRTPRRLPGFRFEVQPPPLTEALPRMDVAAFVGFAATGPLNIPVAVEDIAQFAAIFGNDLPLAWDQQQGETIYAYLAPAVRAFFRNGGRRCWVVRVAGDARFNYFPIPGLAQASLDEHGKIVEIRPAFAQARAKGSWSDSLRVSATLLSQPIIVSKLELGNLAIQVESTSPGQISAGDLLCLTFHDEGYVLMLVVNSIEPVASGMGSSPVGGGIPGRNAIRVTGSTAIWFSTVRLASPPPAPTQALLFTYNSEHAIAVSELSSPDGGQTLSVKLHLLSSEPPEPGSLLRIDLESGQAWLKVQDLSILSEGGSPLSEAILLTGPALLCLKDPPPLLPGSTPTCEQLTFELEVRQGDTYPARLSDLAFEENSPRFWGALPTDEQLYQSSSTGITSNNIYADLWLAAAAPRFSLAGNGAANAIYFPIAMPVLPEFFLGSGTLTGTALERDGLSQFDASLFLEPDQNLLAAGTTTLMAQADFLRYQSPSPRSLTGIYAALAIDEATLIAVPDAVHRGWHLADPGHIPIPENRAQLPHPEWWHFLACDPPPSIPLSPEPQWGNFLNCNTRVIDAPVLYTEAPDQHGTFALSWSSTLTDPGTRYILEEATLPDFSGAVTIYEGRDSHVVVYGRSPGTYYYHVRAEVEGASSDWSEGILVSVVPAGLWQLLEADDYSTSTLPTLLAVQRALLRMCGARGDIFAVLALPEHFREDDAENYVAQLKSPPGIASITTNERVSIAPLGLEEAFAFSYGSIYHPWLIGREEDMPNDLRSTPPDGAACGVMAQRAFNRGAWIAPANEPLNGVVALTPTIAHGRRLDLLVAQINLIQQEPQGFVSLSADTLSDDGDLRPINVRRLLILLRRLALKLGATYVFEPNNDAFRRLVQRGFEAMLEQMFIRGAFAGDTPETAFQVVTSSSLNTPQSVEQGRFIVELRVAPSLPMTFLTLRLVQADSRAFVTEGQ